VIQKIAEETGKEISPALIWDTFQSEYLNKSKPYDFKSHTTLPSSADPEQRIIEAKVLENGQEKKISGNGNGPIAAYVDALGKACGVKIKVLDFHQHATGSGADATAIAYIEAQREDGKRTWGVGMNPNIVTASLKAVTSAVNRALDA
jgi:2-isopropylmalate synthase